MCVSNFSDLRVHYQTGRSYVKSGTGRDRVYGYRTGMMCNLGDIEKSEWCQLVKDAIERAGEQELHQHLLSYLKEHNYTKSSKAEMETEALELHAARIFDNEAWVEFLEFNRKYRPEILSTVELIWVRTTCCSKPGQVTRTHLDNHSGDSICCPHCGRWSSYESLELPAVG